MKIYELRSHFTQDTHILTISSISLKAIEPIITKFHVEPPGAEGKKICSNHPGHIANMAAMPIYGKKLL